MKAIHFKGYGNLEANIILKDIPMPSPGTGEALIKIHAASVNPVDYKIVKGAMRLLHRFKLPSRLGYDLSGIITEVGAGCKSFKPGDEVYARVGDFEPGTFAEYKTVEEKYISIKPKNLTHEEAACLPLVGQTSVQVITDLAKAKPGQKILIHAGSGGIGVFAIQYAKAIGLYVATTTSTKNIDWVRSLGADLVIDYTRENYLDIIKDYDIVYDTLGGATKLESLDVLKKGGTLVSIVGPPDRAFAIKKKLNFFLKTLLTIINLRIKWKAKRRKVNYFYHLMDADGKNLGIISELVEAGKIKVHMDRIFPLENALEALELVESRRAKGKVVVLVHFEPEIQPLN